MPMGENIKTITKNPALLVLLVLLSSCSTVQSFLGAISDRLETSFENVSSAAGSTAGNTTGTSTGTITSTPVLRTSKSYILPKSYEAAYSFRNDTPNQKMRTIPKNTDALRASNPDEYVRHVAGLINDSTQNEFEKVKMAHDIVALLVKYDAANFWAGTVPDQSYRSVLKSSRAVCEGYANTFKKFCDMLEIPCELVHGFARGVGSSPLVEDTPVDSNHAWNIVTINGENYLVDCTWDSGYMDGRTARQSYTTDWLFLKPEHFLYTHYPENARQQLLASPLSAAQFSALPFFKPKFFDLTDGISINLQKINRTDNALSFEYTAKEGYRLSFNIADVKTGREIQNRCFTQTDRTKQTVYFSFPAAGQYEVNVFWFKAGARQGEGCGEFIIETSSANAVEYPTVYSSSAENLHIISPIEMPLEKNKEYIFKIRADNKNTAAIIHGRTFTQMTKGTDGIFSADFKIPDTINKLSIGVANSERGRHEIIAEYSVK